MNRFTGWGFNIGFVLGFIFILVRFFPFGNPINFLIRQSFGIPFAILVGVAGSFIGFLLYKIKGFIKK